jgi:hypothetical protein
MMMIIIFIFFIFFIFIFVFFFFGIVQGNLGWAYMQQSNFVAAEAVYR